MTVNMETDDIRSDFVKLFGENAPPVPRNKDEMSALSDQQKVAIEATLPKFYQSVAGEPDKLPAAVSLRREKGTLEASDIPALKAAGLAADAVAAELAAKAAGLQDLIDRVEKKGKYQNPHLTKEQEQRKAELEEARLWSMNNRVGRRF